ncbi:MAG: hypothetical protein CL917_10920 [Deltaproteobacteria bacterium]|nr:hypothetical protein [Deltaproteobacteria bacterium]
MKKSTKTLLPLFLMAAIIDSSFGSMFALLAKIRGEFDFEIIEIAVIGGAGFVSAFTAQIGLARFADQGHTRLLIWGGTFCAALSMFGLAFSESLSSFIVSRFLFGLGEGAFLPAARRIVILTDTENTGESLGRLSAFQMFGFLIGPLLGSIMSELLGLQGTFLISGAIIIVCMPLLLKVNILQVIQKPSPGSIRNLLAKKEIVSLIILAVGYYGSFGIYESIWAIYLDDLGASQFFIGFQLTLFALPMIIVAPLGGRLAERKGGMTVAFWAIALSVPAVAAYGMTSNLYLLTLILCVHGIADAVGSPAIQLATSHLSGENQASGQGLLNASGLAVAAGVALGSGAVYQNFGAFWLFFGWAIFMTITTLTAILLGRSELKREARERSSLS